MVRALYSPREPAASAVVQSSQAGEMDTSPTASQAGGEGPFRELAGRVVDYWSMGEFTMVPAVDSELGYLVYPSDNPMWRAR